MSPAGAALHIWFRRTSFVLAVLLVVLAGGAQAEQPSLSILHLASRDYVSQLEVDTVLGEFDGYRSYAVTWDSDGLRQSAVMNVPSSEPPESGFPVVIMCHGNSNGRWDSYREYYSTDQQSSSYLALPHSELIIRFAREGHIVLFPDYRGHGHSETQGRHEGHWQLDRSGARVVDPQGNFVPRVFDDDGMRFGGWLYTAYYTIDILNLIAALDDFVQPPDGFSIDSDRLFLWGRSLGGDIAARAMTVSSRVRAASLWVPATMSLWDQAHHYHFDSPCCADGFSMEALAVELEKYNARNETRLRASELNPANYVDRVGAAINIQVSIDDPGARSAWGIQYHYALLAAGADSSLLIHEGSEHVFTGTTLEKAIQADLQFFHDQSQ